MTERVLFPRVILERSEESRSFPSLAPSGEAAPPARVRDICAARLSDAPHIAPS